MSKVRVHAFTVSLDGYGAGPDQSSKTRSASAARRCTSGSFPTRTFRRHVGKDGGTTGIDDDFAARGFENIGAWILGRNMFGPVRGPWPDENWKGWWGDNPPYHVPVFVLTHHARAPIDDGRRHDLPLRHRRHPRGARAAAKEAAGGKDVRIGGGVATIRAVPAGGPDRRDAPRDLADAARAGRAPVRGARLAAARL